MIEVPFVFDKVRPRSNGRFAKSETVLANPPGDSKQTYELEGRLKNRQVNGGGIVLEGKCASNETFTAKRVRG
ncbi:MAG: hypothetical protein AB7V58_13290 [Solirubrobacterales bacterium]